MNIELLLKRFDDLSDAPERISGIRRVILAYLLHTAANSPDAIRRAVAMRESHAARRREHSKSNNRREPQSVSQVSDADLPPSLSDLPVELFERLGNVASIDKGLSQIQNTKPGPYPLVVTAEARSSSESFDFEGAAAIVPLVSSTGHGDASLKRLHYQEGRYAVGNILAVVKPICPDLIRARFIYEYLSAFKEELLVARMTGTANVSLTVNKLKEVPVPLVSGPVLSRIDELMALCDRLEAQQQERETRHAALARASLARFAEAPTPANLEWIFHPSYTISPADLRKAILTLAVQGKLVARIGSEGTGTEILERAGILIEQIDDVPEVPPHWVWSRLGNVATRMDSGWSPACIPEPAEKGQWGVLKTTAVQILQYQEQQNKTLPPNLEPRPEHEVMDGDVLFTRAGPMNRVGILCVARPTRNKLMISDKIIRFHLVAGIDPDFAALSFSAGYPSEVIEKLKSGMAASQVNISQPKLKLVPIPIPPLAEQRRIVAKVEQLMALVDALERQLAASRATAEKLLSALVAELTAPRPAPEAETTELHVSPEFTRAVLAAEIVDRLRNDPYCGQVKLQKILYLAEYHFRLPEIESHALRYAAGPHDAALIHQVEDKMREYEWFAESRRPGSDGHRYEPLARAGAHRPMFEKLWPEQATAIRAFIDEMKTWKTERCERFATLYSAWNDLIHWDKEATDDTILEQVLKNWNTSKTRIPRDLWLDSLRWMREHGYIPTGFGRATQPPPQAELSFD